MKKRFYLLYLLCLILTHYATGQQITPSTGPLPFCTYEPDSLTQMITRDLISRMYQTGNKSNQRTKGLYKIPVVVHVIEPSTSSSLITDVQIEALITNLNQAYRGQGAFASSPDTEIEFELAAWGPDCQATTGITRYDASANAPYVSNGVFSPSGVTWETVQGWITWPKSNYMNIWLVEKMGNGAAGVGGPSNGFIALASEVKHSFDYVSPHEVGHYLGVAHPFPGYNGDCGCGDGDGLADTPNLVPHGIFEAGVTGCGHEGGCSQLDMAKVNPCTGQALGDIQRNIMNYTNYQCGVNFTNDQKNLMRSMLESYHFSLLSSSALSATQPVATASLQGPNSFCASDGSYPAIRAVCDCGDIEEVKINGTVVPADYLVLGYRPILSPGQSVLWNYELKCSNGLTASKGVNYYNIGATNILPECVADGTFRINFSNPNNYTFTATTGVLSGSSVHSIPNATASVSLQSSDDTGCTNTQTINQPCCATGTVTNANCNPTAPNGTGNYFGVGKFEFGNIISKTSSTSYQDQSNYIDNACSHNGVVIAGDVYPIHVAAAGTNPHFVKVWIDYNNNGIFESPQELVANAQTPGGGSNFYNGTVSIPATAVRNTPLRIRVLADFVQESDACNIYGFNTDAGRIMVNYGAGQIEDYAISVSNSLPVGLISFKGISASGKIDLSWETTWEEKNKGFDILRSENGTDFETIGYVDGKGLSAETMSYTFVDAGALPDRTYYYQLNQIDYDGKTERSRIIQVKSWYETLEAKAFPNPVSTGEFVVSHPNISAYSISLISLSGTEIPIEVLPNKVSGERLIKGFGKLTPGLYVVRLKSADGLSDKAVRVTIR